MFLNKQLHSDISLSELCCRSECKIMIYVVVTWDGGQFGITKPYGVAALLMQFTLLSFQIPQTILTAGPDEF